jgi:hypothetical protein
MTNENPNTTQEFKSPSGPRDTQEFEPPKEKSLEELVEVMEPEAKEGAKKMLEQQALKLVELWKQQEIAQEVEHLMESLVGEETSIQGVRIEEVVEGGFRAEVKLSNGETRVLNVKRPARRF